MNTTTTTTTKNDTVLSAMTELQGDLNRHSTDSRYSCDVRFLMSEPNVLNLPGRDRKHAVCKGHAFFVIRKEELQKFADGKDTVGTKYGPYDRNEREAWSRAIENFDWDKMCLHGKGKSFGNDEELLTAAARVGQELQTETKEEVLVYAGAVVCEMSLAKRWQGVLASPTGRGFYRGRRNISQNTRDCERRMMHSLAAGDLRDCRNEFMRNMLADALKEESPSDKLEKSIVEEFGRRGRILGGIYDVLRAVGYDWSSDTDVDQGKHLFSNEFTEEKMEEVRANGGRVFYDLSQQLDDLSRRAKQIEIAGASLREVVESHKRDLERQHDRDVAVREYVESQNESEVK